MSLPSSSSTSEFDILKASHKFLREGDGSAEASWNDQLAQKYYDNLFREFAVCDLKHYKSGNFALRWRTEAEVLSGAGENTCGNTRCKQLENKDKAVQLSTLELPFAYEEHGERKSALVKVVLCPRCLKKLMWKRNKGKVAQPPTSPEGPSDREGAVDDMRRSNNGSRDNMPESTIMETSSSTRRRSSRSRSPRPRKDNHHSRRRRSISPQS